MIKVENLNKFYDNDHVLRDISFNVAPKEIYGVIGPSGAGKSTLIRCLNLLEHPSSGNIFVDKHNLCESNNNELRKIRKNIGYIFQSFNLLSSRTALENIALPLEIAGIDKSQIRQKIAPLLKLTGLEDKANLYPSNLSGGQKQRVAIARALANDPKILLCDEPTSALDPETTHDILQLLKKINEELGVTIVIITHEMAVIKEICDRLAIIESGQITEEADVVSFFSQPKTAIAKKFIRTAVKEHLPENIQRRIVTDPKTSANPLLQIAFKGQSASQPIIAKCIQEHQINLNIWLANIETIADETVGTMIVEAIGDAKQLKAAIAFLKANKIFIEVIGYVD